MGGRPPISEGLLTQLGVKGGPAGPPAAAEGKIFIGGRVLRVPYRRVSGYSRPGTHAA